MSSNNIPLNFTMQVQGDADVQAKFNKTGDAAEQLGQKTEKASQSASTAAKSYLQAAGGISTAALGIAGLSQGYGNLEKVELRIQQSEKSVHTAQASLLSSQQQLKKLVDAGTTSGAVYEQAQLRVKSAQEALAIANQQVEQSQGDLSDAQTNFALSIVPTVIGSVSGLKGIIDLLKGSQTAAKIATALGIPVSFGDAAAKDAQAIAAGGAATATDGLALSTRLLNLAMGPVGLIILGVSAGMALFATNAFGVRDAINAAGKAIGDAIPILKPLLDMLGGLANAIFPQTKDSSKDMKDSMVSDTEALKEKYLGLNDTYTTTSDSMLATSATTQSGISANMETLASNTEAQLNRMVEASKRAREALESIGAAPAITPTTTPQSLPSNLQQLGPNIARDTTSGQLVPLNDNGTVATSATTLPPNLQRLGPNIARDINSGQLVPLTSSGGSPQSQTLNVTLVADGTELAKFVSKKQAVGL